MVSWNKKAALFQSANLAFRGVELLDAAQKGFHLVDKSLRLRGQVQRPGAGLA